MKNIIQPRRQCIATLLLSLLSLILLVMSGCSGPDQPKEENTTPPAAPVIATQPASQTINEGSTAILSVTVSAVTGVTFTYQWQAAAKGSTIFTDIANATGASYTTPTLTSKENGIQYRVVVKAMNAAGLKSSATSDIATLTVSPATLPAPPVIITHPASVAIAEGSTASVSIRATHPTGAALSYQWQTAAKGSSTFTHIVGATRASYTTPTLTAATSGVQYRVVVTATNAGGLTSNTTSNIATISVFAVPPPVITKHPVSQSIEEGNTISLSVAATAATGATLSYQWQAAAKGATDFTDIEDATSDTYTTPALHFANSGVQYRVVVTATNAGGLTSNTTSNIATISVFSTPPPVITKHPASQSIEEGNTISLSVAATAATGLTLSYQWQSAASGATDFTNIANATSDTYTTPALTVASSGVQYRVVVTATNAGELTSYTTSNIATVAVFSTPPPVITNQPASQSIEEGNTVSLSVAATAATGATLNYQWQSAVSGATTFEDISGATSDTYTTPALHFAHSGVQYRVVVTATNTGGLTSYTTSVIATISVSAVPPPVITKQPASQSIEEGRTVSLSVAATAATGYTLSYQWQSAVSGSTTFASISGATSDSYTILKLSVADSGVQYRVVVTATNAARLTSNTTSNIATISVFSTPPPVITKQPASQSIEEGNTVSLSVAATVATGATLSYQWQTAAKGSRTFTDIAGATSDNYTTPALSVAHSGVQYRVVVTATNAGGLKSNTMSGVATISVSAVPPPVITKQPASQSIEEGNTVSLSVAATAATGYTLSYQWQSAVSGSTTFANISGATSDNYTTPALTVANSGVQYRVVVTATNAARLTGSRTSGIATISVFSTPPPVITNQPASQSIEEGNTVSLSVAATVATGATLSYQWQKAVKGATTFTNVANATSDNYTTPTLIVTDSGVQYRVVVTATNTGGLTSYTISGIATISVSALPPPIITTQPASQSIEEGNTVSLSVGATATTGTTLSYQWRRAAKGTNSFADISGATSASYTTPTLTFADSGVQYRVVVKATRAANITSNTTSNIAAISVSALPPPVITKHPTSQSIEEGNTVSLSVGATAPTGATLSYQWQSAVSGATSFTNISGATRENYTTPTLNVASSGVQYRVVVKATRAANITSNTTSRIVTISVFSTPPPVITKHPASQSIDDGNTVSLSVAATAPTGTTLSYQWQSAVRGSTTFGNISGATRDNYMTPALAFADSGIQYRVVVTATNTGGLTSNATSNIATISVSAPIVSSKIVWTHINGTRHEANVPADGELTSAVLTATATDIKSVNYIPSGVTSIGDNGFFNCTSLTSIKLPNTITTMGWNVFKNCTSLTSIAIPGSITTIEVQNFQNCSALASVTIAEGVTTIENAAFYSCTSLDSITIPSSMKSINYYSFAYCRNLAKVRVEATTPPTADQLFSYTHSSLIIRVPDGSVAAYKAAAGWSYYAPLIYGFNEVVRPRPQIVWTDINNKKRYANAPLNGDLKSEVLTDNDTEIKSVDTIPTSVTSIENLGFTGCTNLTSITLPTSVTSIKIMAFKDCSSLTSINIPSSVKSMDSAVFSGCTALTSITLPNSVTSIGTGTFRACSSLTRVRVEAATPPTIGIELFAGTPSTLSITVPSASVTAYRGATNWSNYSSKITGH